MKKTIRQILSFLKSWLWTKPVSKPPPIKAKQVVHNYVCVKHKEQWINLRKSELEAWNSLSRSDRRAMANRFKVMEKKGKIKFVEIDGQMTCVKNKDYGNIESRA